MFNIKSAESYRPYEHYLIDSLQNVDPRVIDLKLYQGNWKQINAQNINYIGWLPVVNAIWTQLKELSDYWKFSKLQAMQKILAIWSSR